MKAEPKDSPRNLPCPNCNKPDRLTSKETMLGYRCSTCINTAERKHSISMVKKAPKGKPRKVPLSIRIPPELDDEICRLAVYEDRSRSQIAVRIIEKQLLETQIDNHACLFDEVEGDTDQKQITSRTLSRLKRHLRTQEDKTIEHAMWATMKLVTDLKALLPKF